VALIQFNEEQKKILEATREPLKTAQIAFESASRMVEKANDKLWNRVHELFPESAKFKDLQILWEDGVLICMDKKEKYKN